MGCQLSSTGNISTPHNNINQLYKGYGTKNKTDEQDNDPVINNLKIVSKTLHNLAITNIYLKKYNQALLNLQQCLQIKQKIPTIRNTLDHVQLLNNIGVIYQQFNKNDEAVQKYKQALQIYENLSDTIDDGQYYARILHNIGLTLCVQEKYGQGLGYLNRARGVIEKMARKDSAEYAKLLKNIDIANQALSQKLQTKKQQQQTLI